MSERTSPVIIPKDVLHWTDDIFGEVTDVLEDKGVVADDELVKAYKISVRVNNSVVVYDIETEESNI